jgi:hypothetical protein
MIPVEFAHGLLEQSKKFLLNEDFQPAAFVKKDDSLVQVPAAITGDKYRDLGALARSMKASDIVMIFDAAARKFKDPEAAKYAAENMETEAPLCYPKSMRQEMIVLVAIDFSSRESRCCVMEYSGEHPDFKFEKLSDLEEMEGAIPDHVLEGWSIADQGKEGAIKEISLED